MENNIERERAVNAGKTNEKRIELTMEFIWKPKYVTKTFSRSVHWHGMAQWHTVHSVLAPNTTLCIFVGFVDFGLARIQAIQNICKHRVVRYLYDVRIYMK